MSAKDIVLSSLAAIEAGDFARLESMLAEDMVFSGPVPVPLGKDELLAVQGALCAALPDWRFNVSQIEERGNEVHLTVHVTGTHTGRLDLPIPGVPSVPATGMRVQLPPETIVASVAGGKVRTFAVTPVPGGGVMGILSQLGVKLPAGD